MGKGIVTQRIKPRLGNPYPTSKCLELRAIFACDPTSDGKSVEGPSILPPAMTVGDADLFSASEL